MIIGLVGRSNSGKTTIAKYICKHYKNFEELSFAKSLKDYVSVKYNLPRDLIEGDTPESREWRENHIVEDNLTVRQLLIKIGTEKRDIDPDYWINLLKKEINPNKNYVISDCRFQNEIDFINSMDNGFTIKIIKMFGHFMCDDEYIDDLETDLIFYNYKNKQDLIMYAFDKLIKDDTLKIKHIYYKKNCIINLDEIEKK